MKKQRHYRRVFLFALIPVVLLLSGCATRQDLWVYSDESWKFVTETDQNFSALPSISASIIEELKINMNLGAISEQYYEFLFQQRLAFDERRGLEADFRVKHRGDTVIYRYEVNGQTLDQLEKLFSIEDIAGLSTPSSDPFGMGNYLGEEELSSQLQEYFPSLHIEPVMMEGKQDFLILIEYPITWTPLGLTFTLHGRKINDFQSGAQVSANSAVWHNPQKVTASFKPTHRCSAILKTSIFVLGGGILVVALVFLISRIVGSGVNRKTRAGRSKKSVRGRSYLNNRTGRYRRVQNSYKKKSPRRK